MPPNANSPVECTGVLNENDAETNDGGLAKDIEMLKHANQRRVELVWRNIILFIYVHIAAVYGVWLMLSSARLYTTVFSLMLYLFSGLGITAGAHRLWAHRSYKARLPLRILLTTFNTLAFQDCAIHWARDHRVHHKYSETDADPHNATRYSFIAQATSHDAQYIFLQWKTNFLLRFAFPEASSSLTLAGCCARNIQKLLPRVKVWTFPTLKPIPFCISKESK